ncbi:MAG TPA: riboflavin synthase [Vicinamibacterales bacterium]|jgi:riboflavin synthase
MFTGLIEAVGHVADLMPSATELRLRLTTGLASELAIGDSVAVNGVCLTVISSDGENIYADVSPETARVTAIGSLKRGALVNLERPLRADARIGGHFVQGHVDGTGRIDEIRREGDSWWITIDYPSALAPSIVRKGSIAMDGISLTVAGVDNRRFDVQIIPYTWEHTNLRTLRVGEAVNLECDILGKYVFRALEVAAHGR